MLIADIEKYVIKRTEEFKKELNEEVKQMIKEANQGQVKSIWDLKKGDEEKYYRLYSNGVIVLTDFSSSIDRLFRYMGNAFLTIEEAEFTRERRKIEAIMRKYSKPFKYGESDYCIEYYHNNNTLNICRYSAINYGIPYFKTIEIAEKVIEEIGEDRLKKYWFGVKG